jgi:hypothetical protein
MTLKKLFEMLNRLNHTPSHSNFRLDAKIVHKESTNAIVTTPDGKRTDYGAKSKTKRK